MEFRGHYVLSAPRIRVWEALNDTAVLRDCIPGCRRLIWTDEQSLQAEVQVNLGVVKPVFVGELVLSDIIVAQRYTLSGRGKGGLLGWAHGSADIVLADHEDGTELAFAATGAVDNRLARLGQAVVGKGAQGVIDRFFDRFADRIGATATRGADARKPVSDRRADPD